MACCDLPPGLDGAWLRKNYLFGVVPMFQGRPAPEELYTRQICAAVKRAETRFKIKILPHVVRNDLYDIQLTSAPRFKMRLTSRPVRKITRWAFRGWSGDVEIDIDRVQIRSKMGGEVELDLTRPLAALWDGYRWNPGVVRYHHGAISAAISLDYLAGMDGAEFEVEADLADWIGYTASLLPLDTAGDLIAGAGIASKSVGQDGLSQSLSTTSSATNAGYGARILSYQKRLPGLEEDLKARYRAVRFSGI
jgi:hypothetical protein